MRHAKAWLGASAAILTAGVVACSAGGDSAFSLGDDGKSPTVGAVADGGSRGGSDTATSPSSALNPTDNAIILVHAAGTGAFRLCFENYTSAQPTPDAELMPAANVVGVEVGSAVRLDPLRKGLPPGDVILFEEALLEPGYFGKAEGPDCSTLLNAPGSYGGVPIGTITTDLSSGVHLLVVEGCQANGIPALYDTKKCGSSYDGRVGNLSIREQTLTGSIRSNGEMPTQVVHLSQALETFRGSSSFAVSFGPLASTDTTSSAAKNPTFQGEPANVIATPKFDPTDLTVYGKLGFRVSVDGVGIIAEQSLADIQVLSAPRAIPTTYYSTASNYVLLMLGAPTVLPDGGATPDAGVDAFHGLHFLAVPVIEPKPVDDGGAPDGGAATASDASTQ